MKQFNQEEYDALSSLISDRMYDIQDSLLPANVKDLSVEEEEGRRVELTSLKTAWDKIRS